MAYVCQICGKKIDPKFAFCKVSAGKKKYYCSKAEFEAGEEAFLAQKKVHDDLYRLVCDIIGEPEIIVPALDNEWSEWNRVATNEKIIDYLEDNKSYLIKALSSLRQKGAGVSQKVKYLSAIIKNHVGSYYKEPTRWTESPPVDIDFNFYEGAKASKPRRRALSEVEDML